MATPNVGILTNAGKNLIDRVNAGQTKITFSKIVFSSMNNNQLTDDQRKALTTVAPQEVVINNPEVTLDNNTGETRIRATGTNKALNDGVYVKTYAVYAKDGSSNEILYGITVSPNPNYLPEYDGVTPQAVTYSYKVNISNTSKITFTNSNDIYVSDTDLAEALQPYAKTVDVNQQLDKKVNVADMRKPASDVAGIEEVNAKQDKIGYTPADDSKVVHTTDTANWQKYPITDVQGALTTYIGPSYQYINIKQFLDASNNGFYTTYIDLGAPDTPDSLDNLRGIIQMQNNHVWGILTGETTKVSYYVGGAYSGNTSDLNWIKLADDSKVAHLSGANNFDTVPTVNNNPLLLASSLPPDIARTGQANTFTAAQTFSIAPTIKDASKDKGDNQAATMADLKSLESSAWRVMPTSWISISAYSGADEVYNPYNINGIYRIVNSSYILFCLNYIISAYDGANQTISIDFSSIVSSISNPDIVAEAGIITDTPHNGGQIEINGSDGLGDTATSTSGATLTIRTYTNNGQTGSVSLSSASHGFAYVQCSGVK